MPTAPKIVRSLGTMVVYGFPRGNVRNDLAIAKRLGATHLEILPDWSSLPDPAVMRRLADDEGLTIHSAHGCWGARSIRAKRVDLADFDEEGRAESVDDLRRCVDWLDEAGGRFLVVHPGGLSAEEDVHARRAFLANSLRELSRHAEPTQICLCVENMPPGVWPGSRMSDIAEIVARINRPNVALAVDTGHANIMTSAAEETIASRSLLRTTHVHDNDGRRDTHEPPGLGTVDWDVWIDSLDLIGYEGPIVLECIKRLREQPELITPEFVERLRELCGL
jgi:sugar phosphate isomerase/epimerase